MGHSRESGTAELSGSAKRNHGDASDATMGHFYFFQILIFACNDTIRRRPKEQVAQEMTRVFGM